MPWIRIGFVLFLLGVLSPGARAEDWTTTTGKTYKDVHVVSHDAAYATILHADGGGKIPLSVLSPALQKKFGYDPAQAAAALAAAKADEQKNNKRLAAEKARIVQQQRAEALASTSPDTTVASNTRPVYPGSPPALLPYGYDGAYDDYGDDAFYGSYGGYFGYSGYGYGGFRGYRGYHGYGGAFMGHHVGYGMSGFGFGHR